MMTISVIKKLGKNSPILEYYDWKKELVVESDAFEKELGPPSFRKEDRYTLRVGLCHQRSDVMPRSKRSVWPCFSLERFHQYTYGRTVTVLSDHKPLESIVRKPMCKAPRRLQNMLK